jgi:hypothetical protein
MFFNPYSQFNFSPGQVRSRGTFRQVEFQGNFLVGKSFDLIKVKDQTLNFGQVIQQFPEVFIMQIVNKADIEGFIFSLFYFKYRLYSGVFPVIIDGCIDYDLSEPGSEGKFSIIFFQISEHFQEAVVQYFGGIGAGVGIPQADTHCKAIEMLVKDFLMAQFAGFAIFDDPRFHIATLMS